MGKNKKIAIELIIFDLDGTLVDTKNVILNAFNHTLKEMSKETVTMEEISDKFGLGVKGVLKYLFKSKNPELIEKTFNSFREYWEDNFAIESKLFPGVIEILEHYKNKETYIMSNGIKSVIEKMLGQFGIDKYFEQVITGDDEDCIKPSSCPIDKAISIYDLSDKGKSLIVGDMDIDIQAGKKAGIKTCAVTYGIGKKKDILKAQPDYIIENLGELKNIVV